MLRTLNLHLRGQSVCQGCLIYDRDFFDVHGGFHCSSEMIPCWMANFTRAVISFKPSFCMNLLRYVSTVLTDRNKSFAASALVFPSAINCRTCRSRGLSPSSTSLPPWRT